MFCEKCGNQLPDDSLFCDKCGAKVEDGVPAAGALGKGAQAVGVQVTGAPNGGNTGNTGMAQGGGNTGNAGMAQGGGNTGNTGMAQGGGNTGNAGMAQGGATSGSVAPVMMQASAPQNLPQGMAMDENGNYRWTYKPDMIKVPVLRNMIMKIIFFSCLGVGAFIGLINLIQGEDLDVILTGGGILAIVGLVILAITFVVYYIVISIHGRYYAVDHLMNEEGVEHIQSPEEDAKSDKMKKLVFALELLNPDPATIGLAMAGKEHMTSEYKDVKKVVAAHRYGLIKVHNTLQQNHIYAYPEQYEFVWNYITQHCPNAKIKG